jgi:alpha-L-fucosidase 2
LLVPLAAQCAASDLTLWYRQPAAKGMNEALPIGSGWFGGLIYAAPAQERIVLNEISFWTGTEISSDNYKEMGSYQMLGELLVDVQHGAGGGAAITPGIVCASEHKAFYEREEIAAACDGNTSTKWCVEHHGKPVIWELRLAEARPLDSYSLTSANDTPARDPSTWEFCGSDDGRQWTTLDRHENEPSFEKRGVTKTYALKTPASFRLYRLVFQPSKKVPHFQVAEIGIPGVILPAATGIAAGIEDYRRALDLGTAVHTVCYKSGGVVHRREAFASHGDGVMAVRFLADRPASCTATVTLKGAHNETMQAAENTLTFAGVLENGLKYETKLVAIHDGGTVRANEGKLEFQNCDSVTLLLAAGTNYAMDYGRHYRGEDPHPAIERRLTAAALKGYDSLKAAHIADYQSLFNRVSLNVGTTPAERRALPTDQRKVVHAEQGGDPELEALLFQYGRYLMISCSRAGGLPANLQGLWNDSNNPPWHSDYHANINVQMNYWPAEPSNLAECHTPLFDLITSQLPAWRKATAAEKRFATASGQSHGWAVRTSHGINGDEGWQWDLSANAWYCQHFWMHYAFGGDKAWLKDVAYPVMKETCEFWEDRLKALPDGRLVVPNGWSPEHGPHEDGVSYCQQIVWDLFNNFVAASEALGVDAGYRAKIAGMRDALVGPKVGSWGQLQEWMTDRDKQDDHHRHTSHLFAVFPGNQISVAATPEFAAAARKSLVARGEASNSDVREWSFAWRSALYARLRDGDNAHRMVQSLLANRNTCKNLFGLHPPMQMDGNFGITAGICEMLLQSQASEIELLPALPSAWPTGKVAGLRARGGFTVDIQWNHGKVTSYRIASMEPREVKLRINGETKTVQAEKL